MTEKIIGSNGMVVVCNNCENDLFELPKNRIADELVQCKCGQVIGPYLSLLAFAEEDQSYTPVNANLRRPT